MSTKVHLHVPSVVLVQPVDLIVHVNGAVHLLRDRNDYVARQRARIAGVLSMGVAGGRSII